jgi:LmbE family N-acetylglucosaminyl deacetylase
LLFMSPDLLHDVKAGHCVRTIYITAGDSGSNQFYWLSRQQGSEAAYSKMLGTDDIWIERIVKINDREYITVANPRGNPKISLIFVHLPDGGIHGEGFPATAYETLAKLDGGNMKTMHAVDGQSYYGADDLVSALSELMHTYQPSEIRTQANYPGHQFTDHSDHMAVGRFVKRAYAAYENQQFEDEVQIPIKFYIGYPVHERPENISGADLATKEAIFFQYARFDGAVCITIDQCNRGPYVFYLTRQYQDKE